KHTRKHGSTASKDGEKEREDFEAATNKAVSGLSLSRPSKRYRRDTPRLAQTHRLLIRVQPAVLGASGMAAVGPVFFALVLFLGSATDGGEGLSFFPVPDAEKEGKSSFWFDQGMSDIEARLKLQHGTGLAKRVVIFLGDGMGLSTVTAARIYKGQKQRKASGEESVLSWDAFPHVSLSRTYGLNVQTSDSANTATAYLCGVKANYETLGVDSRIRVRLGC
ncbi:unnamed protein product, partial [Ixodes persulcatus]